jgi:hypothetical protein
MYYLRIFAKFASSWRPAGCNFHTAGCKFQSARCKFNLVGCQPDANFIQSAASQIQYKIPKFINSLHAAGDQPNEICIWLADSQIQILQK